MALDADLTRTPAGVSVPRCPVCSSELRLGSSGSFDHWSCPSGHGLAMTMSEGYERLQEDELAQLWAKARTAPAGPLTSPFGRNPMARVAIESDVDEAPEGTVSDGATTATVTVDIDVDNQFIWLDAGELEDLPADLADAEPDPDDLAKEREIVARFGESYEDAAEASEGRHLTERLYRRVARHPGALSALDKLGRGLTSY